MTINFMNNRKSMKRMIIEEALFGTCAIRKYYVGVIVLLLIFISGVVSGNRRVLGPILFILILIVLPIFRALITGNKVYREFGKREVKSIFVIEENKIFFETYFENELKESGVYNFEDIKDILSVKKYSFIHFKNRKSVFLDNDSFIDGSIQDLKRDYLIYKSENSACEQVNSDAYEKNRIYSSKGFKITCIVVCVFSILLSIFFNQDANANNIEFGFWRILLLMFALFYAQIFGVVSYIVWFKKQNTTAKVVSILFFSFTYGIIFFMGFLNIILFLCDMVKMIFNKKQVKKGLSSKS